MDLAFAHFWHSILEYIHLQKNASQLPWLVLERCGEGLSSGL